MATLSTACLYSFLSEFSAPIVHLQSKSWWSISVMFNNLAKCLYRYSYCIEFVNALEVVVVSVHRTLRQLWYLSVARTVRAVEVFYIHHTLWLPW